MHLHFPTLLIISFASVFVGTYNGFATSNVWAGIKNYKTFFTDSRARNSVVVSLKFLLGALAHICPGMHLTQLLLKNLRRSEVQHPSSSPESYMKNRNRMAARAFALPALVTMIVIMIVPFLFSIYISFNDDNLQFLHSGQKTPAR